MRSPFTGPRGSRVAHFVRREPLLAALLAVFPVALALARPSLADVVAQVHVPTLAALLGLMVLSRGLEDSGALRAAARWLIRALPTERRMGVALMLFAAGLAGVITNDVALLIVVPLVVELARRSDLRLPALVVFLALAVNAGSAVSPIGNPQNLFLWKHSGTHSLDFIKGMAPLCLPLLGLLAAACALTLRARPLSALPSAAEPPIHRPMAWTCALLYAPFVVAHEAGYGNVATLALVAGFLLLRRDVLARLDWLLVAVFVLMFLDSGLLARVPALAEFAARANLDGFEITLAAALGSQVISNVPATLVLARFTDDWQALAWGATVGGFGLAIGSLANLIALRLARAPGLALRFHVASIAAWALGLMLAWWLLPAAR